MLKPFHPKDDCPQKLKDLPCPLYGGPKPETIPLTAAGSHHGGSTMNDSRKVGEMGTCGTCGYFVVYDAAGKPRRARKPIGLDSDEDY